MSNNPLRYYKPDSRTDWYRRIKARRKRTGIVLNQGDIIEKVPKYVPIRNISKDVILSEARYYDAVIVLTQSCDFERDKEGRYKEIDVTVCPISPLKQFFMNDIGKFLPKPEYVQKYLESTRTPDLPAWISRVTADEIKNFNKRLVRGHLTNYYLLDKCNWGSFNDDFIIVDFNGAFSIDIRQLLEIIRNSGERIRLQSPYNEGLSQAYGLKYMRVAQPVSIDKNKFEKEGLSDPVLRNIVDGYLDNLRKTDLV